MMKLTKRLVPILAIILLLVNCGESGPTITDHEVIVRTGSMDIHFSRGKIFPKPT